MEYIRTFTREFDVGDAAGLLVDNRSGSVTVRGEDTGSVRVEVVARLWADDDAEADEQADLIRRGIRQEGNQVTMRAPALLRPRPFLFFGHGPRIDYQVTAPRATEATITSRTGRVEVESLTRLLDVDVRTGRVGVRAIDANVRISSRSGSTQAEAIGGSLTVESRTGSVRVSRCAGDVTVQSRTGSVHVEDAGGKLSIENRTGSVRYDGAVRGPFDIDVRTGLVRLAVDPDSVFFLDAQTTTGSVRSDLPLRRDGGGAPSQGGGPTVRVRTVTGAIRIGLR